MAQTLITPLELTRKTVAIAHGACKVVSSMDTSFETRFRSTGYDGLKIGPTLQIKRPNQFTVRTGWSMAQQDITETSSALTIDTVRGIDVNFPEVDLATRMGDDELERVLTPMGMRIASEVDKVAALYIKNHTNMIGGTAGTQPNTTLLFSTAAKNIINQLAPDDGDVSVLICPDTQAVLIGGLTATQFNPQAAVSRMWTEGKISDMLGYNWKMSPVLASHTCGTRTNATPIVVGATQGTAGTVVVSGAGVSKTWTVGDIFTMAGCYEINPETKQQLSSLKQLVVKTAGACDGSGDGTITFEPSLVVSGPYQNCSGYPTEGGAVTHVGTASYTYTNDIIMHRKAFAFASAPLSTPKNMEVANVNNDGFRCRYMKGYDIVNAQSIERMDIFFGMVYLRPEWATRVIGYGV
jgi:hypothetical protein